MATEPDQVKLILTAANTGNTENIVVTVFACEYVEAPANVSGADVLKMVEVTARAHYDTATSKFVTVSVKNAVASY
jgi:hypothetical protein